MQTYTVNDQQFNFANLIKQDMAEPVLIKNDVGNKFLVMPFSEDKIQNVFLMWYKSYKGFSEEKSKNIEIETKTSIKDFTNKWLGFMKGAEISENYKEEYYEFLNEKYK